MARLPRPSGKELLDFLTRRGYRLIRVRGSHHVVSDGDRQTSIPIHSSNTLKIGTLKSILRDVEMSAREFEQEWNKES